MNNLFIRGAGDEVSGLRSWIRQLAIDREAPSTNDLIRLFATSVVAYRASKKRADAVSSVPLVIYDKAGAPLPESHQLMTILRRGYTDNMRRSEIALCFWGYNLLYKRRAISGLPYNLRWVNPRIFQLDIRTNGLRGFRVSHNTYSEPLDTNYIKPPDAVYMNEIDLENDFDGTAPIEVAFSHVMLGVEMAETQLAFMKNRAVPAAIAQPADANAANKPDVEERNRLQKMLESLYKGSRNAGRTMLNRFRWEWITIQSNFKDTEFQTHYEQAYEAVAIAFDMPVSLVRESASNFAQQREVRLDWAQSWVKPRVDWYAEQFTQQFCNDQAVIRRFGAGLICKPDTSDVPMFKEDETQAVNRINAKVTAGYKDLYTAAVESGEEKPDERLKGKYMWGGVPTPIEVIDTLWQARNPAPMLPTPAVTGETLTPNPAAPEVEQPTLPEARAVEPPANGKPVCVMIGLGGNPDLIGLQNRVKQLYADTQVKWNAADDFHVTLLYAPLASDEQIAALRTALEGMTWPDDLSLGVGSLRQFDNLGEYAIHFRVGKNPDLLELQENLYEVAVAAGIATSSFSVPAKYIPHITMGYVSTKPKAVIFSSKINVTPVDLQLAVGEEIVYRRNWQENEPTEPEPTPPARRWIPDEQFTELKNWQVVAERKGRDYAFTTKVLDAVTADFVRSALRGCYDLDAVFRTAYTGLKNDQSSEQMQQALDEAEAEDINRDWQQPIAIRSYTDTRTQFVAEMVRIIGAGQAEDVTKRKFTGSMQAALRKYGLMAFRDGMKEAGYEPESLSKEEVAAFNAWRTEQAGYIKNLAAEVFKQGISEAEVSIRAELWGNVSLNSIYYLGMGFGGNEIRAIWMLGRSEEHCDDCPRLDGHVRPMAYWMRIGLYPGSLKTECKHGCNCSLVITDKPVTKDPLPIAVSARSADFLALRSAAEIEHIRSLVAEMGDVWEGELVA